MTSIVTIEPVGDRVVQADANGNASMNFNISNISGGSLRIGLRCEFENAEHKDLTASPQSDKERDLNDGSTDRVIIDIASKGAVPGKYKFKLLVYSTINPNLDFTESELITIEVPEPKPQPVKKPFPWWIPITATVSVLLLAGILTWVFWPDNKIEVPDVIGQTEMKARENIVAAGLVVGAKNTAPATTDFQPDTVMDTDPKPGGKVEKNTAVTLTVALKTSNPPPVSTFQGTWINKNSNTRSITKLIITQSGNSLKIHPYGKCSPTDCDWKVHSGVANGKNASVTINQGFVVRSMQLTLNNNELVVVTTSKYNDNRATQKSKDVFSRSVINPNLLKIFPTIIKMQPAK